MNTGRLLLSLRKSHTRHFEMYLSTGVRWHLARCARLRQALVYLERRRSRSKVRLHLIIGGAVHSPLNTPRSDGRRHGPNPLHLVRS